MLRLNSVEILAPAGTYEAVEAAVRCGANAVYLGGKSLNARRNAGNFSAQELKEAVEYCHARNVKVYLTLNTLATDKELKSDVQLALREACEAGIDALIVQDMGVARLAKKCAPTIPLHASTQMSVHTLSGVRELSEIGFTRAVLSRELSLDEIEYITKNSPIEIEVFVHGALCMCVSGQCLMSAMLGSRSANRGLCAQPCRLPFAAENGTGNDLSLKDLSAVDYLEKLKEIGVKSFKIEGRMKRPEYVAAAVTACKNALEGKEDLELKNHLKGVFSRSGFTHGYLTNELGRDMFGIRSKDDVLSAKPALKELAHLYEKETPLVGVSFMFCAYEGETASLSAKANGKSVFVEGDITAEPAKNVPLSEEKIRQQLEKCGGTQFFAEEIEIDIDDNISLPLSSINALRRNALDELYKKLKEPYIHSFHYENVENSVKKVNNHRVFAYFSTLEQVKNAGENVEKILVPLRISAKTLEIYPEKTIACLPRVFFGKDEEIFEKLTVLKEKGLKKVCCATLDAVNIAKRAGLPFMMGYGSNVFNYQSVLEYRNLGAHEILLSPEMTLTQASALGGDRLGLITYGRLPLMVTRNCPVKNGKSCADCGGKSVLTDRMGISFPVICGEGCSQVLNSRPVYMADRERETAFAAFYLLYFTTEAPEECEKIISAYENKKEPDGEFTRGLYYRGVE